MHTNNIDTFSSFTSLQRDSTQIKTIIHDYLKSSILCTHRRKLKVVRPLRIRVQACRTRFGKGY